MDIQGLSIKKPPIFSFEECLWYLDRGYDECLYQIKQGELRRAISIHNKIILFRVRESEQHLLVDLLDGQLNCKEWEILKKYVIGWFDLDKDLESFYQLLERQQFGYMTEQFKGLRLMGIEDLFEALCWSVIGQQINLSFAYRLKRRLVEAYGTRMHFGEEFYYIFPTPQILSKVTIQDLRAMQFSEGKARYLLQIAQAFVEMRLSKEILLSLQDYNSRFAALTSLKGVGTWTANYVLMKTLREPSSIPFGDAGLIKALKTHQIIEHKNDLEKIRNFFSNFHGWESYLVFYLWRSLSVFQRR